MSKTASPFSTPEDRQQSRVRKKDALLLAAARMFNERGFHATSLDDVAADLGVTKPTVYHYLGNKDQVLLSCVRKGLEQLCDAADHASGVTGDGFSKLKTFLTLYAEITMSDFGMCVNRTGEELLAEESAKEFRMLKSRVDMAMRSLIAEGVADGSVVCDDVKVAAFTIAGALNWPARWYKKDGSMTPHEIAEKMVSFLCKGLEP